MILENIAIIASVISGLAALTTSLRAIGKSREIARNRLNEQIRTSSRVMEATENRRGEKKKEKKNGLGIYLLSTLIWFVLSLLFAGPVLMHKGEDGSNISFVTAILPFLILFILICFVWWYVINVKR